MPDGGPRLPAGAGVWFRGGGPRRAGALTLVCLPHAGGGASTFKNWAAQLPGVDVLAVQYPGHEGRWSAPLSHEPEEIVEPLALAIEADVAGPYALFGHSLGGLLAFEVARAMRRRGGGEPAHLFVSGVRAPDAPDLKPPAHTKPDAEFREYIRLMGGVPEEAWEYPELVEAALPVLRAGLRMYATYTYVPDAPLRCPITALAGDQDDEVERPQVEAWARHTRSRFRLHGFPGGHFFITSAEAQVLSLVRSALGELGELGEAAEETASH